MADFDIEFCPHCGKELNYTANTCSDCGEDLPSGASYCPNCGQEVDDYELICAECGKTITKEDVDKYNQLSQEEKAALHEAYLQKQSEEIAKYEALRKEVEKKRRMDREQYKISKAQDEATINEITDYIKSQVSFDCKLSASLTLTFIDIKAKIVDTGYTVSAKLYQKDKATALPKFVQTLIAIHDIVGKYY